MYQNKNMLLIIQRTIKQGLQNFLRNGWLSVASVSILFFSLFIISLLFTITTTAGKVMQDVQDKVNVSVYFKSDVPDEKIMEAKKNLESFSEVKSVSFVSKEQALEDFKKNNANEPAILQSLEEIGENPLLSYLVVKAQSPDKYDVISKYVTEAPFAEDVGRVNYEKNKEIIKKFNMLIGQVRKIGVILGSIFALVAILITFNTVRITIYTHKEEIEIMRLVGASNIFIRLPFILEGLFYGIIASLVSMLALFVTLYFGGSYISGATFVKNLTSFYFDNWLELFALQVILGSLLGIVGSTIAMRKYLKV